MKKLFLLSLISAALLSCSKDKNDGAPASIDGYWTGTWSYTGSSAAYEMAVILRGNGTARILYGYNGGDTSNADYITEDHFTYDAGIVQFQSRESSFIVSYRGQASGNRISGTWGELPSYDDGGTWTMTR